MSRSRHFVAGVLSSYVTVAVNVLYTITSIPLALHYLTQKEFGLWSLITQLTGYLMLLDLGMSVSVGRFLADYKDNINGGHYGSVLLTGQTVFAIQGTIIACVGALVAFLAAGPLAIPSELHSTFAIVMSLQCVLAGLNLGTRMLGSPLWSHQRYDISNFASSASLLSSFVTMWLGFHFGLKIYSLLLGTIVGFVFNLTIPWLACHRMGFYPSKGCWGRFDFKLFKEMFGFGGGLFLMNFGSQLTSASQVIILTRILGLDAAATWAVMTKPFALAQQFIGRIFDSSAGGLTEMHVRNERPLLAKRFRDLVALTSAIAAFGAIGIALLNSEFVKIWTSGKITWSWTNNFLLGLLLLCTMVTRCHTGLVGISKEIRGMKYIYLVEGICFISLAIFLVPKWSYSGLIISSIVCNLAITGVYGIARSAQYLSSKLSSVANWTTRALIFFGIFAVLVLPFHHYLPSQTTWLGLLVFGVIFAAIAAPLFWWIALPLELRKEIARLLGKALPSRKSV